MLAAEIHLRDRHARRRHAHEGSHRVRQTPQRLRARIITPGLGTKRVDPEPVAAVRSDFQPQPGERIEHALVLIEDLHLRVGLDHRLEQPGGAAPLSGFWIDWNWNAAPSHQLEHGRALEYAAEVNLGPELAIELFAHLYRDHWRELLCPPVERNIDWQAAPAHALQLHHEGAAYGSAQQIEARPHCSE